MKWGNATYFVLFVYILCSILFWGFTLQRQNNQIARYELEILAAQSKNLGQIISDRSKEADILQQRKNRTLQFLGEGAVFIIITLLAGYILYSNIRKQKKLSDLQNNFMLSVTHELKSPIAGVKLNLQTLNRPDLPSDKRGILIQRSLSEADRLNNLCNNLLLASQMEGKHAVFNREKIDFSALCEECIEDFHARSYHTMHRNIQEGIFIHGDLLMWKIAVNNLIENAIKYSEKESNIYINLQQEDGQVVLSVADEGVGISDEEKIKIFNKFYRVGKENSRKTKGTGLGLFLTAEIIRNHDASITVKNNIDQGTIFEVSIPTLA